MTPQTIKKMFLSMNERKCNLLRLAGLLVTVIVFIGHYFIPQKQIVIHPSQQTDSKSYGYINPITGMSDTWINKKEHSLRCDYQPKNKYGCGLLVYFTDHFWTGIDLTHYDGLLIDLNYEGPSEFIRVYLRNYDDAYSSKDDGDTTKFLSMVLGVKEIGRAPVYIQLSEFTVAEWWVNKNKIRRQFSHYQTDNIVNIGIDYVEPGLHYVRINTITAIGQYIETKTLLFYIVIFWLGAFIFEGILRFYLLYQKSKKEKYLISKLRNNQLSLEEEREKLRVLSTTDPLTEIANRSGMTQYLHNVFYNPVTPPNFGLLLFDIDHFKSINDSYGHDVGDSILKEFARVITGNIRSDDHFARWGGEEFILITPSASKEHLTLIAEKFRALVENHIFTSAIKKNISLSMSIGMTSAREDDVFEDTFKRADSALYKAKNEGRNCSRYEY